MSKIKNGLVQRQTLEEWHDAIRNHPITKMLEKQNEESKKKETKQ
jgi:hypothetical protein